MADPLTIGAVAMGAGSLWGAHSQGQANKQNARSQDRATDLQAQRQQQVTGYVKQFLQQGQNPYGEQLMSMLGLGSPTITQAPQGSVAALLGGGKPVGRGRQQQGPTFQAPTQLSAFTYDPSTAQQPGNVIAQLVNAPQLDLGQFAAGNQAFNLGQDALTQAINRGPATFQQDPAVTQAMQQMFGSGGNNFVNTDLFSALEQRSRGELDQSIADLQGSFGSFGERLGTAAMNTQARMRQDALSQLNLQRQQLASQSFENAQGRLLQAMGLGAQREGVSNQFNQAGLAQQIAAAQGLGQLGMSQAGLLAGLAQGNQQTGMQGLLANQQAGLNAGQMNQQTALQTALANMAAQNAAGQFNAGQGTATGQFNAAQGQNWNQFLMQGLAQAAGLQQGQMGQNIGLISLLAGLQAPPVAPVQPSPWAGALGDLGQLAMMYPMLRGMTRPA